MMYSINPKIDQYLGYFINHLNNDLSLPFSIFLNGVRDEFSAELNYYFDHKVNDPTKQDYIFNNLTTVSNILKNLNRLEEASYFWNEVFVIVDNWETSRKKRIHKGSLFYFWSELAIKLGQFDKGFFLIYSAYEEDVKSFTTNTPDTPAYKTISLNYLDNKNLLFNQVTEWSSYLNIFINNYDSFAGRDFTLENFFNEFLLNPPSRDTLASFTYNIGKLFVYKNIPQKAIQTNFTSLYEANILFDLVLVIQEVLILKQNATRKCNYMDLVKKLISKGMYIKMDVIESYLSEININKDNGFERVILELLERKYLISDNSQPSHIECDIGITYCLRNYSAHNIDSYPIIRDKFSQILQSVFNSLFYAIEIK
jgi:hypothetical protein